MSNYKFYVSVCVVIPAKEMQWIVNCLLDYAFDYDNNTEDDLKDDVLYDVFDEKFDELFDKVCSICNIDTYFRCRIYLDVKNTVFTMVHDEFEKRRG